MAKTEIAQGAAAGAVGSFTALGSVLAQHGTSTLAVALALAGAVLAAVEMSPFRWRTAIGVVIFNSVVGVIGGAVLTQWLADKGYVSHPLTLGGLSFLVSWLGHDWLRPFKRRAISIALKAMAGAAK